MRGAREGEALFWAALAQWGLRLSRKQLRTSDGLTLLERRRVPEVWRRSIESAYTTMFGRADGPATLRGRGYVWPLLDALSYQRHEEHPRAHAYARLAVRSGQQ